jgi:hypothetical protein
MASAVEGAFVTVATPARNVSNRCSGDASRISLRDAGSRSMRLVRKGDAPKTASSRGWTFGRASSSPRDASSGLSWQRRCRSAKTAAARAVS